MIGPIARRRFEPTIRFYRKIILNQFLYYSNPFKSMKLNAFNPGMSFRGLYLNCIDNEINHFHPVALVQASAAFAQN
ncbi:hypothetical protein CS542_06785 [Pedobacter sp. IW39]|nr:hypothetical protein CS542_06785 [Pedobacter sp. IW39]